MKWIGIVLLVLMLVACSAAEMEPDLETANPEREDTPEMTDTPIEADKSKDQEMAETPTPQVDEASEGPEPVLQLATPDPTKTIPMTEGYPAPDMPIEPPPDNPTVKKFITLAKEDLAKRLGISIDSIQLIAFEYVTWPDTSMGCPQPDMMYAQVLVDGYRIILQADSQLYNYHGGGSPEDGPFLCENVNFKDITYPPPRMDDK